MYAMCTPNFVFAHRTCPVYTLYIPVWVLADLMIPFWSIVNTEGNLNQLHLYWIALPVLNYCSVKNCFPVEMCL